MDKLAKVFKALEFAANRHKYQTRKGKSKTPYINHPIQVAKTLISCDEDETDLIVASLLHDVVEDTAQGEKQVKELSDIILSMFGENVLLTVLEVSDNKSLPVDQRKQLQVQLTPNLSDRAKKLKIADKICNIQDIICDPPEGWSDERKIAYVHWAKQVVNGARGLNHDLDQMFDEIYEKALQKIE